MVAARLRRGVWYPSCIMFSRLGPHVRVVDYGQPRDNVKVIRGRQAHRFHGVVYRVGPGPRRRGLHLRYISRNPANNGESITIGSFREMR